MKREAEFGLLFRHWLRSVKWLGSSAFELKQTTTDSIPFSDVQEHQIVALQAAKGDGLLYKIPDDSRGVKPFDFVFMQTVQAYIVIRFPNLFCLIPVDRFTEERDISERKSLTSARARQIALICVDI
jgi:penicillin-binding protein-related factor A (putative recombinase)